MTAPSIQRVPHARDPVTGRYRADGSALPREAWKTNQPEYRRAYGRFLYARYRRELREIREATAEDMSAILSPNAPINLGAFWTRRDNNHLISLMQYSFPYEVIGAVLQRSASAIDRRMRLIRERSRHAA